MSRRAPAAAVAVFLAAALALTWWRTSRGAELVDEAFSVLVPWRWALGDRPFVDEQNLSQSAGLLAYPFVKLYAVLGGHDVTGLVLYERHLYMALAVIVAGCVYLLARRTAPAVLAVLVAAPFATVILFETPQLTANALGALFLAAGAALGAIAVLGGSRWWALLSGVSFALAGVAYPTVALLAPFVAVFLAFSLGRRSIVLLTRGRLIREPVDDSTPSGKVAWRAVSAWALGGVLVTAPIVMFVVTIAGPSSLRRSWHYTIALADRLDQLGGASKAVEVTSAFVGLLLDQWYIVAAAVVSLAVYRLRPGAGRWLLLLTPPAVWLTGTAGALGVAGGVIMYALAAPYLYLFVPTRRREDGARLLIWIWAPAVLIGAMTAYTSADGFERAAVGLLPGMIASGLFLAWGLEPLGPPKSRWVAVTGLAAIVVVTLAFQVQFQSGRVALSDLSARMDSGPWKGITLTEAQRRALDRFAVDLERTSRPDDRLLVYPQGAALYLYWPGEIAANTYQLYVSDAQAALPGATVDHYRRERDVPTLVVRAFPTAARTTEQLRNESAGLAYEPVLVAPGYVFLRKPPEDRVGDVLARLRGR